MIWFDGGADDPRGMGPDVEPIIAKYQPNYLFYHNVNRADLRGEVGKRNGGLSLPVRISLSLQPQQCKRQRCGP